MRDELNALAAMYEKAAKLDEQQQAVLKKAQRLFEAVKKKCEHLSGTRDSDGRFTSSNLHLLTPAQKVYERLREELLWGVGWSRNPKQFRKLAKDFPAKLKKAKAKEAKARMRQKKEQARAQQNGAEEP